MRRAWSRTKLRNELAGVLAGQDEFGVTVLRGTVLDNAALMGLLHRRLRHAGLHVINMDAMPASEPHAVGMAIADDVVTLDLRGRLDDQSASLLDGGQVIQESVTTTVRYRVASGSDLGALLNQVKRRSACNSCTWTSSIRRCPEAGRRPAQTGRTRSRPAVAGPSASSKWPICLTVRVTRVRSARARSRNPRCCPRPPPGVAGRLTTAAELVIRLARPTVRAAMRISGIRLGGVATWPSVLG